MAATYHTHPRDPNDSRFSDEDVATAIAWKARSYIGIARTGKVRVFDPATMRAMEGTPRARQTGVSGELLAVLDERADGKRVGTESN